MGNAISDSEKERGYSREEKYFYELNRDLIEKRQREREAKTARKVQPKTVRRPENAALKGFVASLIRFLGR